MGEVAGSETCFAVLDFELNRLPTLHFVREISIPDRNKDIVVTMAMQQRGLTGRYFDLIGTKIRILKDQMMVGLRGDFDLPRVLRDETSDGQAQKKT